MIPAEVLRLLPDNFHQRLTDLLGSGGYTITHEHGMIVFKLRDVLVCRCVDTPRFWWYIAKFPLPLYAIHANMSDWTWLIVRAMKSCGGIYGGGDVRATPSFFA